MNVTTLTFNANRMLVTISRCDKIPASDLEIEFVGRGHEHTFRVAKTMESSVAAAQVFASVHGYTGTRGDVAEVTRLIQLVRGE